MTSSAMSISPVGRCSFYGISHPLRKDMMQTPLFMLYFLKPSRYDLNRRNAVGSQSKASRESYPSHPGTRSRVH